MKCVYSTFAVPCEKSKIVSLTSSIMKSTVVFPAHSRFPMELIFGIAFLSVTGTCCLLRSIAVSL